MPKIAIRRAGALAAALLLLLLPLAAQARDSSKLFSVQAAVESPYAEGYLLDVPFSMRGADGAPEGRVLSTVRTDQSTNGAMRSDEKACQIAFLGALKRMQQRAQQASGDAIVDVVSVTRGETSASATEYRCVAGAVIVHVGLEGKVVDLP